MRLQKILAAAIITAMSISSTYAAFPEISCDTDSVFNENACTQCFEGWSVAVGDNLGLLTDDLLNDKSNDIIVYKEEQEFPSMVSLSSGAEWSQTPSEDDFWEYTDEFNSLYSEEEDGYLVSQGTEITWLQSQLGYAYTLDSSTADAGSSIGLLVYKLLSHDVSADGDITIDSEEHNECVLFKSGEPSVTPPTEEPPELPETGAEHILLLILALLIGFGLLRFMKKA